MFSDDVLILTSGKSGIPSCRGTGQESLKGRSSGDPSAAPTTRFRAAAAQQGARARKQEENAPQESRTPHGQLTMVRSRTAPAGRRSEKSHFPSGRGGPPGSDWLQEDGGGTAHVSKVTRFPATAAGEVGGLQLLWAGLLAKGKGRLLSPWEKL